MRLRLEFPLDKSVDEVFALGAAMVVISSKGGQWLDGRQPVDRDALMQMLQEADATFDESAPPMSDEDRFAVHSGTLDWSERSAALTGEIDVATFSAEGSVLAATEGLGSMARVIVRARPRQLGWRLLLTVSSPILGPFFRMYMRRHRDELAEEWAAMGRISVPHHAREWHFEPD